MTNCDHTIGLRKMIRWLEAELAYNRGEVVRLRRLYHGLLAEVHNGKS